SRSVCADVANVFGIRAAVPERLSHCAFRAGALGMGRRHVMRIAGKAVSGNFSVDAGSPATRTIQRFKYQDACTFTRDHAFAKTIERLADFGRHRTESGKPRKRYARKGV